MAESETAASAAVPPAAEDVVDGALAEAVADASLEDQLKETQREMVKELDSEIRDKGLNPDFIHFGRQDSQEGYWRFLRQSDWNLVNALELVKSATDWHANNRAKLESVLREVYMAKPGLFSLVGYDKDGRPLLFVCFGQNSATHAEHTVDSVISFMQHIAENAGRVSQEKGVEESGRTFTVIVDCTGLQPKAILKPTMLVKAHQTLTLLYPNTIGSVLLFNYSVEVRNTWKELKGYLDADLAAKVKFVAIQNTSKTLTTNFPPDVGQWLKEELAANKTQPMPVEQKSFWISNSPHDPRGAPSYVDTFLSGKAPANYQPHPGILHGPASRDDPPTA